VDIRCAHDWCPNWPANPPWNIACPQEAQVGHAAYVAFYTVHRESREVKAEGMKPNPFLNLRQGRGIKVAQWLVREGIHAILLPADRIEQKGFIYVLQASGVRLFTTRHRDLGGALEEVLPVLLEE